MRQYFRSSEPEAPAGRDRISLPCAIQAALFMPHRLAGMPLPVLPADALMMHR